MNSEHLAFDAHAYDLAVQARELTASRDYLNGISKKLTAKVASYSTLPTIRPLRDGQRVELRTKRVVMPPVPTRNLTVANRAVLRKRFPEVYARAVTVTPPARKYRIRLDVQRGLHRRTAIEWQQIDTLAEAKMDTEFNREFEGSDWRLKTTNTFALYCVKERLRVINAQREAVRTQLAEYIEAEGLPTSLRGVTDGLILAQPLADTYATDYDVLEDSPAASLITRRMRDGSVRITYGALTDGPEDDENPFEGD